ncbi:MAG: ferritin family protein [Pyrodictiaceae archaeon]
MCSLKDFESKAEEAYEIESKALNTYTFGLSRLRFFAALTPDLEEAIANIAVETLIHKYLVKALLDALRETSRMRTALSELKERIEKIEVEEQSKTLLKRFIEQHLDIEKHMVELYKELAKASKHPLIRKVAEILAENEEQHHAALRELLEKLK